MDMKIYVDFKSPASFLALQPTLALIGKTGTTVKWLPFNTSQQPLPEQQDNEDVGARHRRVRAHARRSVHELYARLRGVDMHFPEQPGDTRLALAALSAITRSGADPLPFIQAAFSAYWQSGQRLNLQDRSGVEKLLEAGNGSAALPPDLLQDLDVDGELQRCAEQAEADGVVEAPAYVVHGQLFIGREHLPWIEELLS